jgi:hypothetical protein
MLNGYRMEVSWPTQVEPKMIHNVIELKKVDWSFIDGDGVIANLLRS